MSERNVTKMRNEASNRRTNTEIVLNSNPTEYPGWFLYLPDHKYSAESPIVAKLHAADQHFKEEVKQNCYNLAMISQKRFFELKFNKMHNDGQFRKLWPTFELEMSHNPELTLSILGLAMYELITKRDTLTSVPGNNDPLRLTRPIRVRILGACSEIAIRNINVDNWLQLVFVRGTVIRIASTIIIPTWTEFRCLLCQCRQAVFQPNGVHTVPKSCNGRCKGKFMVERYSKFTRYEPFQKVCLQESNLNSNKISGHQIAATIEVHLENELVNSLSPGDDVSITGIVMCNPVEDNTERLSNAKAISLKHFIKAVGVESNKNAKYCLEDCSNESKPERDIGKLCLEPNLFRRLVLSLCPLICGHEIIKAGLILALFGGAPYDSGCRTEIHVLIAGDPGLGKSQLLQACSRVSPKGTFVSGTSASNAGLTVNVRMEKNVGSTLEAGALVLADQGVCCIDEFDKMTADPNVLLEAMEQQMISVSKAGVICSMPARTSILAAANPAGGSYNKSKTLQENIPLSEAILSRFDLIFIQIDLRDAQLDKRVCSHMENGEPRTATFLDDTKSLNDSSTVHSELPFYKKLMIQPGEKFNPISERLIQKYIAHARANVNPMLSCEAAATLRIFYQKLRRFKHIFPVTARQIEALVRLTQARARIDLTSVATEDHALDVIAIVQQSLENSFNLRLDESQTYPSNIIDVSNDVGLDIASIVARTFATLTAKVSQSRTDQFSIDDLQLIVGHSDYILNGVIDALNISGHLVVVSNQVYKFIA